MGRVDDKRANVVQNIGNYAKDAKRKDYETSLLL